MKKNLKSFLSYYLKHNYILDNKIDEINENFHCSNIEDLKNENFLKLVKLAFLKSEFYNKLYSKHNLVLNDIKSLNDIHKLPIVSKDDIRDANLKIRKPFNFLKIKAHTSGTTGSPLILHRDINSILNENAFVWWYRKRVGLNPKDRKVSVRGDLNRENLFYEDKVSNTLFISSFSLSEKNMKRIIDLIESYNPLAILGYPSSLDILSSWLLESNRKLYIPLAFTSSETLLDNQKNKIISMFNTKIYDWYGNAERSIALYSENGLYLEPPLYSHNEYNSENVITTSFLNNYFPLIRYQVDDKIVLNNSNEIETIEGRIEDYILLPDGTKIGRLDVVFKGVENILMAQIFQSNVKSVKFNIVKRITFSKYDLRILETNIRSKMGNDINIEIDYINQDDIVYSRSGKFKLVISDI
jgi:phenylacetate-CoA ligase